MLYKSLRKISIYKRILIINYDYFIKPWEFENYDFNIPLIKKIYSYKYLDNKINNNIYYNNNMSKSFW